MPATPSTKSFKNTNVTSPRLPAEKWQRRLKLAMQCNRLSQVSAQCLITPKFLSNVLIRTHRPQTTSTLNDLLYTFPLPAMNNYGYRSFRCLNTTLFKPQSANAVLKRPPGAVCTRPHRLPAATKNETPSLPS